MIKTILVPLDGSERAEYVLPLVARLASHTKGTIVLVRVVNIASTYWPAAPYPLMIQALADRELKEATTYLEGVAASALLSGIEVTYTAQHGTGAAAPVILAAATEYHADLIVMCSHRRTGVAHAIIGSVAEKIARHASIPVLIIDEKEELPQASPAETTQPLRALVLPMLRQHLHQQQNYSQLSLNQHSKQPFIWSGLSNRPRTRKMRCT